MTRTTTKTITRRSHWRWQRCGVGRSEVRRIRVGEAVVTLAPTDTRQMDLLDDHAGTVTERRSRRRVHGAGAHVPEPRAVLRSYWRHQPYGPRSGLRKVILVDVHAQ